MNRIFYMFAELITPVLLIPPIMAIYGKRKGKTVARTLECILFSMYLAAVFHLTGQPDLIYHRFEPNVYLIPFGEFVSDMKNSILNVAMFVPLGFFLPTLAEKYAGIRKTLQFALCMTILIELLQMFTLRATDINDIVTNVCGAAIGWLIWKGLHGKFHWLNEKNQGGDIAFCCACTYGIMFFIQPFTYTALYNLVIG